MTKLLTAIALAGSMAATAAYADGAYVGLGLAYAKADSETRFGGTGASQLKSPVIGLTAGYRWNLASGFAAAEVDTDVSTDRGFKNTANGDTCPLPGATGAYYCSHSATVRLRGIYGVPIADKWELYGALGLGVVTGQVATNTNTTGRGVNIGPTIGLGAQHDMGGGKLRIELNYDHLNTAQVRPVGPGGAARPTYTATTLKVSYIFSF